MGDKTNRAYLFWMVQIKGMGRMSYQRLTEYGITPEILHGFQKTQLEQLVKSKIISPSLMQEILVAQSQDVKKCYQELEEKGIRFVVLGEELYPERLRLIPDPPLTLYFYNSLPEKERLSVAIIGARNCSEYGSYVAKALGEALAKEGMTVISGMARGIDGISQLSATKNGGSVYAVLGCGVDICYPQTNQGLYEQLKVGSNQGIISEYPPGTLAKPHLFPPRNRIISGLSDVVVVIEAKQESGTLITVDMALEQGKEIYALPGRVTDRLSDGCNRLIKDGAFIFLSPNEFINDLNTYGIRERSAQQFKTKQRSQLHSYIEKEENILKQSRALMKIEDTNLVLEEKEQQIYDILDITPQSIEVLLHRLKKMPLEELLQNLMVLQAKGVVDCVGNSYSKHV